MAGAVLPLQSPPPPLIFAAQVFEIGSPLLAFGLHALQALRFALGSLFQQPSILGRCCLTALMLGLQPRDALRLAFGRLA